MQAEGDRLQPSPFLWGKIPWVTFLHREINLGSDLPISLEPQRLPDDRAGDKLKLNMAPEAALSLIASFSLMEKKLSAH